MKLMFDHIIATDQQQFIMQLANDITMIKNREEIYHLIKQENHF